MQRAKARTKRGKNENSGLQASAIIIDPHKSRIFIRGEPEIQLMFLVLLLNVEELVVGHEMKRRPIIVIVGSVGILTGPGGGREERMRSESP